MVNVGETKRFCVIFPNLSLVISSTYGQTSETQIRISNTRREKDTSGMNTRLELCSWQQKVNHELSPKSLEL